jgi:hypothetical protein
VKPDFELDPMYMKVVQLSDECSPLLTKLKEIEGQFGGMEGVRPECVELK